MLSALSRFLLVALLLVSASAEAATAARVASPHVVAPYYVGTYSVTVGNAALVIPFGLAECGISCVVVVTPSETTSTLTSLSNGRFSGQTLALAVTGTNTLVVPTSLGNVDFGTAGDLSIVEGAAGYLVWDGTDWRRLTTTTSATSAELNYLDITTLGTGAASKAVVLDSGEDYTWPATGVLTYGGGAITATGTELNQYVVTTSIVDLDTNATYYVVMPHAGTIDTISSVIHSAIATGDATITCNIGATPITGGAITVTQSGSAAGDVDTVSPSAAKTVTAGQAVNCAVTGSNTGAARTTLSFTVTR